MKVYELSRELSNQIFEWSTEFPAEETYSLNDQMRRSSRSVGAQIAEAWGKRRYEDDFINKLTIADAEQLETQHWIEVSFDCGYIDDSSRQQLLEICNEIGRMLQSMIDKSGKFCQK